MNLKKALELRKHKYIRKIRKKGKYGEWDYIYREKKSKKKKDEKYNFITAEQLRYTDVNNFKSGDFITVDHKYVIHLKKEKYKTFSLESSVEDYNTSKFIGSAFWPVYINNFLHGEYKKTKRKAIISTSDIVTSTGKALLGVAKRKKSIIKKMDKLPIGSKIKKYILQDLNGNKVWIHESGSKGLSHGDMLIQYTTDVEKLIKEKINLI